MKRTLSILLIGTFLAVPAAAAQPEPMPPPVEEGSDIRELEQARRELAEAARRVAELSSREADRVMRNIDLHHVGIPRAFLGIVADRGKSGADGVAIREVTEDGPAAKAGLKAGDVLVNIDGHSLAQGEGRRLPAVMRIYEALDGIEPGSEAKVGYLRDGKRAEAVVVLGEADRGPVAFSFGFGDGPRRMIEVPPMPHLPGFWPARSHWNLELVSLSETLGEYFNTDKGLLVVRAPEDNPLQLVDGDVILEINGRSPQSPTHAVRILRSYQAGEKVKIEIMRKRRSRTLEVTLPDEDRR